MLFNRIAVKIAFFLNGFLYANWVSRLPRIQELYHADNGTIGLVLLAMSIGAVGAMPFAGWLISKKGSRKISLVSLVVYAATVPFIALMPGILPLMALYILIGVSTGVLDVAMNAQAVMVERAYNRPIMSSFHAFFSIGMALGAGTGAMFTNWSADLSSHLIIVSVISLLAIAWVRRNLVEDKPDITDLPEGPLLRMPNRALLGIGLIAFCAMLGEGAVSDWSVNYMENIAGAARELAPVALVAFATAMTMGRLLGDRVRARLGDTKLIAFGGIISTAGLAIALSVPLPHVSIAGFFLIGAGLSTIVPIAYSIAGNAKDLPAGVGLAMVTTVGYSGFLLGPPLIGMLADRWDLRIALVVVCALFAVMTGLGFRRSRQPPESASPGKL